MPRADKSRLWPRRKSTAACVKAYEYFKAAQTEDTKSSLTSAEESLMTLNEKCSVIDAGCENRQETRQLEMEARSKVQRMVGDDRSLDIINYRFGYYTGLCQLLLGLHLFR